MKQKLYTISRASLLSGVHINTVKNYCRDGIINPERLSDGTRVFGDDDVQVIRDRVRQSRDRTKAMTPA